MRKRAEAAERPRAVALRRQGIAAAALALLGGAVPVEAQPVSQPRASTIVVLDGSNSMNARLPNDRSLKFVTVRDSLRAALDKVTPGTEVGLAAFGARRVSDCTDAELMVPPSPDVGRVAAALERYQPRGFSPVVLALRTAAKALPSTGKASIVLVIDDLASCRGEDPCAVATDLKRQNPALAIHVVGLSLRPTDAQVLACVTRQTGGQLLAVSDGPGIGPAIEQVIELASLERAPSPAPVEQRPAAETVRVAPPARALQGGPAVDTSRPGLHLTARLAEGKPVLLLPVAWKVWRRGEAEPVLDVTAPTVSRLLPNGSYEVEVRTGLVAVRQTVEIATQGPTPVAVNLNAALLTIAAPLAAGAARPADAVLTVSDAGAGTDARSARGSTLWIRRTAAEDLIVPPGTYRVRVASGLASAERVIAAGAGTVSEMDLPLAAGRLVVQERAGPTIDASGVSQLTIESDDPDSAAGRRELYRAAAPQVELTLPAGAYIVSLRRGAAEARERVLIKPGEVASRALTLPFGRVRLTSRIGSGLPVGLAVRYRIERLDAATRPLQHWGDSEQTLDLTPGRYRFEARIGAQNAVAVREAEVKPGLEYRIDLDPSAGGVQLKLTGAAVGLGFGDVYWQVFDDQGAPVWRTGQAEPVLALGAGRYRARADVRDRTFERVFDVRAGDNRVVEVGG